MQVYFLTKKRSQSLVSTNTNLVVTIHGPRESWWSKFKYRTRLKKSIIKTVDPSGFISAFHLDFGLYIVSLAVNHMAFICVDLRSHLLLLVGLIFAFTAYAVYLAALPKPLPGIPYNSESAHKFFGDVALFKKAKYRRQWLWGQPRQQGGAVSQVFLFPFRRPTVIVTDYREVVDICSRRSIEFDRGIRNKECIGVVAPNFHFTMQTADPQFRFHKQLIRHLMTPQFLKQVRLSKVK
jgi:hypothetical protein